MWVRGMEGGATRTINSALELGSISNEKLGRKAPAGGTTTATSAREAVQANSRSTGINGSGIIRGVDIHNDTAVARTECSHRRACERSPEETERGVGEGACGNAGVDPSSSVDGSSSASFGEVREFRCHRVIFAASSDYFKELLYCGMSEAQARRVELRDVAPEGLEAILTYAYTGRVVVTAGVRVSCPLYIITH